MSKKLIAVIGVLIPCLVFSADFLTDTNFQQGVDYFNNAEYAEARSFLKDLEPDFGSNAEFQYYYGLSLLKTDQAKQAVEVMQRAIELQPGNAEYHYALARIFEVRRNEISVFRLPRMARSYKAALRKAVELDPQHVAATQALAAMLLDFPSIFGGDDEAGAVLLSKLRTLDEAAAYLVEALAEEDTNAGRAEELFLSAISSSHSSVGLQARVRLGRFYIFEKQYRKAIPHLQQALRLPRVWSEPSDANEGHIYLAGAYHFLGDQLNLEKHILLAEETARTAKDTEHMRWWFDHWDIEY